METNESRDGWVRIGTVSVESGTLLMVDPCFHRDGFYGPEEVATAMSSAVESPALSAVLPVAGLAPGFEVGVVALAGLGDGDCSVEARYGIGPRDRRYIAELTLRFEV